MGGHQLQISLQPEILLPIKARGTMSGGGDVAVAAGGRGIGVAAVGGRGRGSGGGRGSGPKARPPDATRRAASAQRSSARFELCCRWQWQRRGDRRPRSWPWSSCSRRPRQSRPRTWWFVTLCCASGSGRVRGPMCEQLPCTRHAITWRQSGCILTLVARVFLVSLPLHWLLA